MSTTGPMTERAVKGVMLALWRLSGAAGADVPMQLLLRETLLPMPDVQEAIVAFKRRGCLIEQSPAGVRLVTTGLACWQDVLEEAARTKKLRIGRQVRVFTRTGSTNDVAWQFATNPEADGAVVLADEQTAGRGRLGHTWASKPEQSILMSMMLRDVRELDRLTLLVGLAGAEAVERAVLAATGRAVSVQIKWPNDLLIEGRKMAGILVERRPGLGEAVVIGIGVNVAQGAADFPEDVRSRATSIYQATGVQIDRLRIVAELVERLHARLFAADDGDAWLSEWKARCGMLGTSIEAREGNRSIKGLVLDVDPLHGLVVRDASGATIFLSAQQTSIVVSR